MDTCAKRQMAMSASRNIKAVRLGKAVRVAVGGPHPKQNRLAVSDALRTQGNVTARNPKHTLKRTVVTEKFLRHVPCCKLALNRGPQCGLGEDVVYGVSEGVGGWLVTCEEQ